MIPAAGDQPRSSEYAQPGLSRDEATVLDRNTKLTGTLHSEGNVLIEGSFEGEIEARATILIDQEASAQGELQAEEVIVSGAFDGKIACRHRFRVMPTGSIKGEIHTAVLVVEEGSIVNFQFIMERGGR
jgi:cytoskeletal protein CcmA (bactofilin family)